MRYPLLALAALALPAMASAQTAADHPHYTKALTDLRLARALLMVPDDTGAKKFAATVLAAVNNEKDGPRKSWFSHSHRSFSVMAGLDPAIHAVRIGALLSNSTRAETRGCPGQARA